MLRPRNIRHHRTPACSYDQSVGFVAGSLDIDGVCIDNPGPAIDIGNAAFVEIVFIYPVETFHISIASVLERIPVVIGNAEIEPVVGRMSEVVRLLRRVPHDFFRYAAHINAGAAERFVLDDGCFRAVFRGALCVGETTTATADDDQVELFFHRWSSLTMLLFRALI